MIAPAEQALVELGDLLEPPAVDRDLLEQFLAPLLGVSLARAFTGSTRSAGAPTRLFRRGLVSR